MDLAALDELQHDASGFRKRLLPLSVTGGSAAPSSKRVLPHTLTGGASSSAAASKKGGKNARRTASAPARGSAAARASPARSASGGKGKRPKTAASAHAAGVALDPPGAGLVAPGSVSAASASGRTATSAATAAAVAAAAPVVSLPPGLDAALMPFQRAGVAFGVAQEGRVLIGDEMGLGKTVQALALAWHYRSEWPVLIVSPSSVRGAWADEIERWFPQLSPGDIHVVRSGADVAHLDAPVTLVTYALLAQAKLLEHVSARRFQVVVLDECHYIKNARAKRTQSMLSLLKQARRTILLSGTPALSRPEELYTQIDALRPGQFGSWTAYAQRYCNAHRGRFGWDTKGASNLEELNTRLQTTMIRRLKRNVLDQLPPKRRQRVRIDVADTALMSEINQQFKDLRAIDRDPDASRNDSFQIMQSLYTLTGQAKVDGVRDYVQGMCRAGAKFLIFAYHIDMLKAIEAVVVKEKLDYIMIVGETPVSERHVAVRHFQADENCRVAVLSILAASQGITLTAASTVVFAELHWTPGIIEQAEDRVHRIGQRDAVNIHFLVAPGTLDDSMWGTISRKVSIVSETLNGVRDSLEADRSTAAEQLESTAAQYSASGAKSSSKDDTADGAAAAGGEDELLNLIRENDDFRETQPTVSAGLDNGRCLDLRSFFGSAAKPAPMDTTPWACSKCTFLNTPTGISGNTVLGMRSCNVCGAQRTTLRKASTSRTSSSEGASATAWPAAAWPPTTGTPRPRAAQPSSSRRRQTAGEVDSIDTCSSDSDAEESAQETVPTDRLSFCVSLNTGRMWLYDGQGRSLGLNFHTEDFRFNKIEGLPRHIAEGAGREAVLTFIRSWDKLRSIEQKSLSNIVMKDVEDGRRQLRESERASGKKPRGSSTKRFSDGAAIRGEAAEAAAATASPTLPSKKPSKPSEAQAAKAMMQQIRDKAKERTTALQGGSVGRHAGTAASAELIEDDVPGEVAGLHTTPAPAKRRSHHAAEGEAEADASGACAKRPARSNFFLTANSKVQPAATAAAASAAAADAGATNTSSGAHGLSPASSAAPSAVDAAGSSTLSFTASSGRSQAASLLCQKCQTPLPSLPWEQVSDPRGAGGKSSTAQQRFCSHECWERFNVLTGGGGMVRRRLLELECGVCQLCHLNAQKLYRKVNALESVRERIQTLAGTPFVRLDLRRLEKIAAAPKEGHFWQADHIQAVCEGGGECDLDNYRTLCTPCHMKVTGMLAPGIKERRLAEAAEGTHDIRSLFKAQPRTEK